MTVQTNDGKFATAKFIVDTNGISAGATHSTIASALSDASSGETIFIKPGTYTEDLTLKAGVNLASFGSESNNGQVEIVGKCTATFAGSCAITGIRLTTNSDFCLAVTGASATIVTLKNCFINCSNNTGISFTSSSSSAYLSIIDCSGDTTTTLIAFFSCSSAGTFDIFSSVIKNSGGSTTANTFSAGSLSVKFSRIFSAINASGTSSVDFKHTELSTAAINTTPITYSGSGSNRRIINCTLLAGTASAISVSTNLEAYQSHVSSSNASVIAGVGGFSYADLTFINGSDNISTTSSDGRLTRPGIIRSEHQPAFLARESTAMVNATGDGTAVTVNFQTEIFDQNGDFTPNTTFTAPFTGIYNLFSNITTTTNGAGHTEGRVLIITSNRSYLGALCSPAACRAASGDFAYNVSVSSADMDAADTATVELTVSNSTKTVTINNTSSNTCFGGHLVC